MSDPVSREEFVIYMDLLQSKIDDGFKGVHARQDTTNGRISKAEDRLRALETALAVLKRVVAFVKGKDGQVSWRDVKGKLVAALTAGAGLASAIKVTLDYLNK